MIKLLASVIVSLASIFFGIALMAHEQLTPGLLALILGRLWMLQDVMDD